MTLPTLRPYQREAVTSIWGSLASHRAVLRVAATGSGKTAEIGALARVHLRTGGKRVMVTAPRGELLDQTEAWLRRWNPGLTDSEIGREQASSSAHAGNKVILATPQTLRRDRLASLPEPDLIIVDEAHLFLDANKRIATVFPNAKRIGFTATPDRSDHRRIMGEGKLFEKIPSGAVYEIGHALRDGWLVKPRFERIVVPALDQLAYAGAEDFETGELSALMRRPEVIEEVAGAILGHQDRRIVVFCVDVKHAERVYLALKGAGANADWVHGGMREREKKLSAFIEGDISILVSVVLLTYGWDAPPADCAVLARPTRSRALYCQSIGRVLRPFPDKEDALILDFVGNSKELRLVTPEDAFRDEYEEEEDVREPAVRERGLLAQALEEGEGDVPLIARVTDWKSIPVALVSQLGVVAVSIPERGIKEDWLTEAQIAVLHKLGLEPDQARSLGKYQASAVIDALIERDRQGLSTFRQARFLQRKGLNPKVSKRQASWAIGRIKAAGWRVPKDLRLDPAMRIEPGGGYVKVEEKR